MKKIVLAGGSGNLGQTIARSFLEKGYQVVILSRSERNSRQPNLFFVQWSGKDLDTWAEVLEGADILLNLSGENINKRFTAKNKEKLESSRILPTRVLGKAISGLSKPPRLWVNFSGISLFGGLDGIHTESDTVYASDFMANLTKKWETAFLENNLPLTKQVILRLSPVLQAETGMFKELHAVTKMGLGGTIGSGKQMVSWIHERDLVRIIHWIVERVNPDAVYHACSPQPVSNVDFMQTMRQVIGVRIGLPLPTPMAKIGAFFKGVDDSLLLQGNAVISEQLWKEGFVFEFAMLQEAVSDLVGKRC